MLGKNIKEIVAVSKPPYAKTIRTINLLEIHSPSFKQLLILRKPSIKRPIEIVSSKVNAPPLNILEAI